MPNGGENFFLQAATRVGSAPSGALAGRVCAHRLRVGTRCRDYSPRRANSGPAITPNRTRHRSSGALLDPERTHPRAGEAQPASSGTHLSPWRDGRCPIPAGQGAPPQNGTPHRASLQAPPPGTRSAPVVGHKVPVMGIQFRPD